MTLVVRTGTLLLPMVERKRKGQDKLPVRWPDFGRRVDGHMIRMGLNNEDVAKALGYERGEMVRRYREGKARPKDDDVMRKMGVLFGATPGELHYGDPKVPGVVTVPVADVTPDEQVILEAYRRLPKAGKKALRVRATELAEEFAPPTTATPFGRGRKSSAR